MLPPTLSSSNISIYGKQARDPANTNRHHICARRKFCTYIPLFLTHTCNQNNRRPMARSSLHFFHLCSNHQEILNQPCGITRQAQQHTLRPIVAQNPAWALGILKHKTELRVTDTERKERTERIVQVSAKPTSATLKRSAQWLRKKPLLLSPPHSSQHPHE